MTEDHRVVGWRCAVCGATREIADPMPWLCPNATLTDRRHLLKRVEGPARHVPLNPDEPSVLAHDLDLAWSAYASANGLDSRARRLLFQSLDDAVAQVDGARFSPTPMTRSDALSDELGSSAIGGVWVKDETHAVAGSHKARHLLGILLHLRAAASVGHLEVRPPLAIASCGNAALAAATLARAAKWPLDVFVPTWMSDAVGHRLAALGARVHRCDRRPTDLPGDPAMLRFREAVEEGAVPFSVQGPENSLCLDTGRTLGWEAAEQLAASGTGGFDRVFVQVGGGALLSSLGAALGDLHDPPRIFAVQAAGCAPLARAWERAGARVDVASRWSDLMTPWTNPHSLADGILDDETYDWLGAFSAMRHTGGAPLVVPEADIVSAHELFTDAGYDVSPTGSAGLAGLLTERDEVSPDECILLVASGVGH